MRIDVTARSSEIKDSARRMAQEKCAKLERFFGGSLSVKVVLDKQHDTSKVEMIATTSTKHTVVVEAEHEDLLAAIDVAIDKMDRSIRRWKEKLYSRGRKPKLEKVPEELAADLEEEGPTYQEVVEGS